jgi:UDP-GlcNAc:undecaprenyl-phosphate GlcNAc-1-phosphate transferase
MGTAYSAHSEIGFLAPLFMLALPLFDTAFVILARVLKKKNPLKGSGDHIALRLKKRGWTLRTILSVFIVAGIFFNSLAYALTRCGAPVAVCLFIVTGALLGLVTLWLLSLPAD